MSERTERLRTAAQGAWVRLTDHRRPKTESAIFAPLTETLVWLTALASDLRRLDEDVFSGLAYARNYLLHGEHVIRLAEVGIQRSRDPSPWKGDVPRFMGQAEARILGFIEDLYLYSLDQHERRPAYQRAVGGWAMHPLLARALSDLGVRV